MPGLNASTGPISLDVDLTHLNGLIAGLRRAPDPAILSAGMMDAAEYVRQTWISAVTGNFLPGMSYPLNNDQYAQGLQTGQSLYLTGPSSAVVVCTWRGALEVEVGKPAFDMKPGLLNGPHSKVSKDGTRYNTVPFRHGTPQNGTRAGTPRQNMPEMPQSVYDIVKTGARYNGAQAGTNVSDPATGKVWQFGQQVKLASQVNVNAKGLDFMPFNYAWKNGLYEGMKQYGPAGHHQYLTFRRVSERSPVQSWWHPGFAPNPIRRAVIEAARPAVTAHLESVVKAAYGL